MPAGLTFWAGRPVKITRRTVTITAQLGDGVIGATLAPSRHMTTITKGASVVAPHPATTTTVAVAAVATVAACGIACGIILVRAVRAATTPQPDLTTAYLSDLASLHATVRHAVAGMSQLEVLREEVDELGRAVADASTAAAIIAHATGRPVHPVPNLHPRRSTERV